MPGRACDAQIRGAWRAIALIVLLALCSSTARAHEFWIEPQHFRVDPGATVELRLFVGQEFTGEALIYLPELVERYAQVGPRGETPISAVPGDDPAGTATLREPGLHRIAYRSKPSSIAFATRAEFEHYLELEGLEHVRAIPDYAARTRAPIHERFSRCAKALIGVGAPASQPPTDRPLGLRLELIAERNPYQPGAHGLMPVRLLLDGKPLAGALVKAFQRGDPPRNTRARTDAQGRALLALESPGVWLLSAVHLSPTRAEEVQWESLWASLTFELGAASSPQPRASKDSNSARGSGRL